MLGVMRLSDDALWLWHDLWEDGVEILDGDRDELCDRFVDENDEPWSEERLEAAIRELRAKSILGTGCELAAPEVEVSSSRITEEGLLVRVARAVNAGWSVADIARGAGLANGSPLSRWRGGGRIASSTRAKLAKWLAAHDFGAGQ